MSRQERVISCGVDATIPQYYIRIGNTIIASTKLKVIHSINTPQMQCDSLEYPPDAEVTNVESITKKGKLRQR